MAKIYNAKDRTQLLIEDDANWYDSIEKLKPAYFNENDKKIVYHVYMKGLIVGEDENSGEIIEDYIDGEYACIVYKNNIYDSIIVQVHSNDELENIISWDDFYY